jgi:hypothetical protein
MRNEDPASWCTLSGGTGQWQVSNREFNSGRSAARLARLVRDQEVVGSNPTAPTNKRSCPTESVGISQRALKVLPNRRELAVCRECGANFTVILRFRLPPKRRRTSRRKIPPPRQKNGIFLGSQECLGQISANFLRPSPFLHPHFVLPKSCPASPLVMTDAPMYSHCSSGVEHDTIHPPQKGRVQTGFLVQRGPYC